MKELASFLFTINSFSETFTITNLSPNSNPVGTGFMEGLTVIIGGITVQSTFVNSTTITFKVPSSLAVGTYPITITNPSINGISGSSVTSTVPIVFTVTPPVPSCNLISSPLRQFAVLSGTAVNNAQSGLPTTITALSGGNDIGLFPDTTVTGFPPGTNLGGAVHIADPLAETAHNQSVMLYNNLGALSTATPLGPNLSGAILFSGVYSFVGGASFTGTLTFDAQNNPGSLFVLQIPGSFGTGTGATVVLDNGAQACNIFFQVGSAAFGNASVIAGNFISNGSIFAGNAVTIDGRLFSLNSNTILIRACGTCP